MAKEVFDFEALSALKFNDYKKDYCKPAKVKKAKACLLIMEFTIVSRKKKCIFIPFNKLEQARLAYFVLKNSKDTAFKKAFKTVVLTTVASTKGDDGFLNVTLDLVKTKLTAAYIKETAQEFFKEVKLNLDVTGMPEEDTETSETETTSESSSDVSVDDNTIKELRKEFQEAKNQSKQISKADPKTRVTLIEDTWNKLEVLMPKLAEFISNSEKEGQKQTATKITEAAKTIQATLKPHIEKIKASGNKSPEVSDTKKTEKSNANLDTLTSGISKKAAQLLAKYQQEIADFDQSSDDLAGDSLADKLKSISQIA